jgi:hypothetical protein
MLGISRDVDGMLLERGEGTMSRARSLVEARTT